MRRLRPSRQKSCRSKTSEARYGPEHPPDWRPAPCCDHHGWQWPLGAVTWQAAFVRPPRRGQTGPRDRQRLSRSGGGLPDDFCLLDRELETHPNRGGRADGVVSALYLEGNAGIREG